LPLQLHAMTWHSKYTSPEYSLTTSFHRLQRKTDPAPGSGMMMGCCGVVVVEALKKNNLTTKPCQVKQRQRKRMKRKVAGPWKPIRWMKCTFAPVCCKVIYIAQMLNEFQAHNISRAPIPQVANELFKLMQVLIKTIA